MVQFLIFIIVMLVVFFILPSFTEGLDGLFQYVGILALCFIPFGIWKVIELVTILIHKLQ